jgi:hypothetical protein
LKFNLGGRRSDMSHAVTDTDKINRVGWGLAAFAAVSGAAVLAGAPWLFPKVLPATGAAFAYDPNFVPTGGAVVGGLWALSALLRVRRRTVASIHAPA